MNHQSLSRVGVALLALTTTGFGQYFYENFNNNNAGWTPDIEWGIGPATASSGQQYGGPDPAVDADGTVGGGVAGVAIGGNAITPTVHPSYFLTSPPINIQGAPTAYLNFARWLNSDYTPYMQNRIDVFDGISWVNIYLSGGSPGVQDSAWTTCLSYDVTAYANAAFQVRFGFSIGSTGVFVVSSWNVDNVSIDANPSSGANLGQQNSAQASLIINGVAPAPCGGVGVVTIPSSGSINLNWLGPVGAPFVMFWSATLNPGAATFPCLGSADIGTPYGYQDVVLIFDGNNPTFPGPLYAMNASGSAYQTFSIPALPSGSPLGNLQGLVFQPAGSICSLVLTKAWTLSVQ
jgi:hypothetical protein